MEVLQLCVFYTVIYMGVAVIAFSFVFERWTILNDVLCRLDFTTCGYGNLTQRQRLGRFYILLPLCVIMYLLGPSVSTNQAKLEH
jgi:hypothetical protein